MRTDPGCAAVILRRPHLSLAALLVSVAAWLPFAAFAAANPPAPDGPEATLTIANRDIVVLRAALLESPPATRVARARARINALSHAELGEPIKALPASLGEIRGMSIIVGDKVMFSMIAGDLDPEDKLSLEQAAERARNNLQAALEARRDQARWSVLLTGIAHAGAVTAIIGLAILLLHRGAHALIASLGRRSDALSVAADRVQWRAYLLRLFVHLLRLAWWAIVLILLYAWLAYVLDHFPLTEPLGRGLGNFVTSLMTWLAEGILASVPGIVTVALILFVTRAIVQVLDQFFKGVQSGSTHVPFLHPETVSATRRIVNFLTWTLALVVAYPFIPGSGSDAFKGLSVLIGVMVSLGSTGLVTQMMSGLVIIYSRALRKGDYVNVNGTEGMVAEVGTLATKVVTMRSEEVTIPNSVLIGSPIHNFSKFAESQGALLSTKVTIGYDAPWRQVHVMLLEAGRRTRGLRLEPSPFVFQRALADFYVEYELFAYTDNPLARVATLSELHANIQDIFNEHGVQIMSPHYVLQPRQAVVVPREQWYATPATPPGRPKG